MKMVMCRICLCKNNLKPIFPDKDLVSLRAEQLNTVTGIEIKPNDGLTQKICTDCLTLVESALKLRELSLKSDAKLKTTLHKIIIKKENDTDTEIFEVEIKTEKHFKMDSEKNKDVAMKAAKNSEKRGTKKHDDFEYSVQIEDFESSNDSDFMKEMNDFFVNDLDSLVSEDEEKKVRIDIDPNDSCDEFFSEMVKKKNKIQHHATKISPPNRRLELKEKKILQRERKKKVVKKQDLKLMSLAVTPYDPAGPVTCSLCKKELMNVANFRSHARTHLELRNACEECGKKFVNPSHMRYHQQRVHGMKKRLACGQCAYRAVDLQQLQNHVRAAHTGERPYGCDVCGDSFRMRANIAQHMRKHFGVRSFQCERCPAMFRSRSELTGHQNRVHFVIYTYYCYLCTETYKRVASVRKHLANVHGVPRSQQQDIKCVKTRRRSCETIE